jgi:predicted NUDIX family NTP pyrophosphohydrolase
MELKLKTQVRKKQVARCIWVGTSEIDITSIKAKYIKIFFPPNGMQTIQAWHEFDIVLIFELRKLTAKYNITR